jgi:3-phosphoshikimate 1-carboxyvinyltransferase
MLRHFGAEVRVTPADRAASASPWSAGLSFWAATSSCRANPRRPPLPSLPPAIRPGSDITVEMSASIRLRAGLYQTLRDMGADIAFANEREDRRRAGRRPRVKAAC